MREVVYCFELTVLYRLLYCLVKMDCELLAGLHGLVAVEGRSLQLICCNNFSLQAQNYNGRDRRQSAKTQSIQIAYERGSEAIQNGELHKQIVLFNRDCIEYLDCLIRIPNHSNCLTICVKMCDRITKMAESRSAQGFERLLQVAKSVLKVLGCDCVSNTIISNSNRS